MKKFIYLFLILSSTMLGQLTSITKFPHQDLDESAEQSAMIKASDGSLCFLWVEENWIFSELMFAKSTNFGETWSDKKQLAMNIESAYGPPEIAAYKLSSGRILVALKARTYHLIYSDDNGETWSEQAELPAGNAVRAPSYSYPGFVELSTGEIWFHYSPAEVRTSQAHTTFYINSENGIDWNSNTQTSGDTLFTTKPNLSMSATIVSTGENNILMAYQELIDGYYKLISRTSINNGITWSDPVIIAQGDRNFENPQLVKGEGNTVWLVYQEDTQTGIDTLITTDIYYMKSEDLGNSWGSAEKFTGYSGYDTYPSGTEVEGILLIAFATLRDAKFNYDNENYQGPIYHEELQSQIYFGFAGEAPDIFTPPVILSENLKREGYYPFYSMFFEAQLVHEDIASVNVSYTVDEEAPQLLSLYDSGNDGDSIAGDFVYSAKIDSLEIHDSFTYKLITVHNNGSQAESEDFSPSPPILVPQNYLFDENYISMPVGSNGIIGNAEVILTDGSTEIGGKYLGELFLYSGGFMLSGKDINNNVWANGVADFTRIVDYVEGPAAETPEEWKGGLYVVNIDDEPFSESWLMWQVPAEHGALFYDGDNDGLYQPYDKNGNGVWDMDEDKPVIIGDEAAWCIYNDGRPAEDRLFENMHPLGIEISQTVFGYRPQTHSEMENVIFIRYLINNSGLYQQTLDSVYFSSYTDPDLNDYTNDLIASDTLLHSGYCYDKNENSPPFFDVIVQGPHTYIPGETFIDNNGNSQFDEGIDEPLDTAVINHGPLLGSKVFPGAKNIGMSGFVHDLKSHPEYGAALNEYEAYNYARNMNKHGEIVDPCEWTFGAVYGNVDCNAVNPNYFYSGDPISQTGWICEEPFDQRMWVNSGPFKLEAGEPVEILVAFALAKGKNSLESIDAAREVVKDVHSFYSTNFSHVPVSVEEDNSSAAPVKFHLAQNYPNPFNPATTIEYSIPVSSSQSAVDSRQNPESSLRDQLLNHSINQSGNEFVSLKVFDILGREVATLVDKPQPPGNFKVQFNAGQLSSGVYFYRLQYGSLIQSKKMLLLK